MTDRSDIAVIGGGIAGITSAIEAAETGYSVILIEKLPYLGGRVVKMNRYFPKLCPPTCGLEINFNRIKQNPNITVITSAEVKDIQGEKGNFSISVSRKPQYVTNDCTVCGECEKVCPESRKDEFNYSLSTTPAIYLPHEMAFPWKYTVDEDACKKNICAKCVDACLYKAINLNAETTEIELHTASIVLATGWSPYDASKIDNMNYKHFKDIISNVEMERLTAPNGPTNGKVIRLSDSKKVQHIAFVQCAGSRDENHQAWCSGVCCSASLKQALLYVDQNKDGKASIFYIDLRVGGRNEDLLEKVKNQDNVELIKGKVGGINFNGETKKFIIEAENIEAGKKIVQEFDLVVLATGIEPVNVPLLSEHKDEFGFLDESLLRDGIFSTGCNKKPMDVSASLKDATGTALRAIQITHNAK